MFSNKFYSQNVRNEQIIIDSLWNIITDKNAYTNKGSKEMLRLCTEIYYQSKNSGYEKGQLRSLVKMSEIYTNEQNYQEALNKISEGLLLAEKNNNYVIWSDLLRLQSSNYSELGYYTRADKIIRNALTISNKIKENDRKYFAKSTAYKRIGDNIKLNKISNNKEDSIQFYYYKAYIESKKLSLNFPRRNMHVAKNVKALAVVYFDQNKIADAEKYIQQYEELTKNVVHSPDYIALFILKGKIEHKKGNYTKAIEYFNKSIQLGNEYKILPSKLRESYSGLAESYRATKDYKNQATYISKAEKIKDSLSIVEKNSIEKVETFENKESVNGKKNYSLYTSMFLGFFLLVTIAFFFFKRKKKLHIQKVYEDSSSTHILENKRVTNPQDLNSIILLARNNDQTFYLKFCELFPTFNQKLIEISKQLTPSDLEYCALMKLNFDTKQIATFKKVSISSVESRKYRIRKKLNINSSDNIYKWLSNI